MSYMLKCLHLRPDRWNTVINRTIVKKHAGDAVTYTP